MPVTQSSWSARNAATSREPFRERPSPLTCVPSWASRPALVGLALVLSACGASGSAPAPGPATGGQAAPPAKTLVVGIQREPTDLGVLFGQGTATTAGGAGSVKLMVHDKLAVEMELDRWEPQLAVKLPSLEDGWWTVSPGGSMDTTWQLHPNIRWHDGAPFSSDD